MTSQEELDITLELLKKEKQADLEQYRQKVLMTPLHRKTKEGISWYPIRIKNNYIGTGERLILEVERTKHLDQPHVFGSGKMVSVFSNANGKSDHHITGVINYVRDNTMVITMNADDLPEWLDEGSVGVDVMFDEMTYREMEYALKQVIKAEHNRLSTLREILLGKVKPTFDNWSYPSHPRLNESQNLAMQKVLTAKDVGIIHGPPGTGKTTTLVESIREAVLAEGQVLVCAPSNAAVDLLSDKISETGLRVVRIGHPARVNENTLSKTMDAQIAAHAYYKDLKAMRKRMDQLRAAAGKYKRDYGHAEREQKRLLRQEARALKADADVLELYIINDLLQNSDVITATLVGSSHPILKGRKFKSVFIDEAAQAMEPACWIPLLRSDRVIFAGDHFQLPPTIKSLEAAKAGLATTLMEKCITHHPTTASMLNVQYRMNEAIMNFSSKYFYNDSLIADEAVKSWVLNENISPVTFIDTAGCGYEEKQDEETLSRFNEDEARLLMRLVEKRVEAIGIPDWSFTIGIITPYRAQVDLLKKIFEESTLYELKSLITIDTVDAFQGQERDMVAISFVRSNDKGEVGFLGDIRRTNVAMTRARKSLLMAGDSATLGSHPFYTQLLEYVQASGFYQSAWEVMEH